MERIAVEVILACDVELSSLQLLRLTRNLAKLWAPLSSLPAKHLASVDAVFAQ